MMRAATFEKRYQPIPAPSGSDFWHWTELCDEHPDPKRMWSVTEYAGRTYVQAGVWHFVNVIAYTVTTQPWTTGDEEARW
jgi:hypothetical protein